MSVFKKLFTAKKNNSPEVIAFPIPRDFVDGGFQYGHVTYMTENQAKDKGLKPVTVIEFTDQARGDIESKTIWVPSSDVREIQEESRSVKQHSREIRSRLKFLESYKGSIYTNDIDDTNVHFYERRGGKLSKTRKSKSKKIHRKSSRRVRRNSLAM
jgi:hypothetical protein